MSGPWENYQSPAASPSDGPWTKYGGKSAVAPESESYNKALADAREQRKIAGPETGAFAQGLTFGLSDEMGGAIVHGATAIKNAALGVAGKKAPYSAEEAGRATTQAEREQLADFSRKHPVASTGLELTGGSMIPLGKATEFVGAGKSLLTKALRSALVGAPIGAVTGAGTAQGGLKDRAVGAGKGAAAGALTGGAFPFAEKTASTLFRGVNALTGHKMVSAIESAEERLREHLKMDGVDDKSIETAIKEWENVGAGAPKLLNVAGENTRALIRAAAGRMGPGREAAVKFTNETRANLGPGAQARTLELTPEKRSATEVAEALKAEQSAKAVTDYKDPYRQPIPLTPEHLEIVNSPAGRKALGEAISTAKERGLNNPDATRELKELTAIRDHAGKVAAHKKALAAWTAGPKGEFITKPDAATQKVLDDPQMGPPVKAAIKKSLGWREIPPPKAPEMPIASGAALDRAYIAMREQGRSLFKKGNLARGGGVGERAKALDESLSDVEHLKEARTNYKAYSDRARALETGDSVLGATHPEFLADLKKMPEHAREEGKIGARQAIADALRKSPKRAMSTLSQIAHGEDAQANLRALFGKEEGDRYIRSAQLRLEAMQHANDISPRSGSQTALREGDATTLGKAMGVIRRPIGAALDAVLHGSATTSAAEREALVKLGLGSPKAYAKAPIKATTSPILRAALNATKKAKTVLPMQAARVVDQPQQ